MSNKEPKADEVMRKLGFELDTNIVDVYDHYINRYTSEWFSLKTAKAITTLLEQREREARSDEIELTKSKYLKMNRLSFEGYLIKRTLALEGDK